MVAIILPPSPIRSPTQFLQLEPPPNTSKRIAAHNIDKSIDTFVAREFVVAVSLKICGRRTSFDQVKLIPTSTSVVAEPGREIGDRTE